MPTTEMPSTRSGDPIPWVSVVMPIRKCRETVARSLDSLLRLKTSGPCEMIFVCDMPDDDSLEVIRNHPLVKQWHCTEIFHPGRGMAQALNLGWKAARAIYILNTHSDCYVTDENSLLRMVDWLERENAVAVEPRIDIPQNDWELMSFWDRVTSAQFRNIKQPPHGLAGKFDLLRRDALEKVGGYDEEHFFSAGEDADMVEKLWSVGKIAFSDVVVVHAHLHPPNARFKSALRKHTQLGQGTGALLRKHWCSIDFMRRAWLIVGLNGLKLVLLIGIFTPYVWPYALTLMLLLAIYYASWSLLSRDWRVVLIPFAVSIMFSVFAISMVAAFIRGRQSFDYIKAK